MSDDGEASRTSWNEFQNPDAWHRPATYWFWHRLPTADEIRTQVQQMFDGGFRSFQIQARLSYPIDGYLNSDYLQACRLAVNTAAELGMIVGIYDDYNWQTGHAGGRAVAGHDHLRERHLFWSAATVADGTATADITGIRSATENLGPVAMAWHYEGGEALWTDWKIEYAVLETPDGRVDVAEHAGITAATDTACSIQIDLTEIEPTEGCTVTVFVSARSSTSRLINPLDRDAVDRFVEAAYEPFREHLGDHFGSTVRYMFFDQPHAVYYDWAERTGDLRSAIPIHASLDARIRSTWGPRYPDVLSALLYADSPEELALRAQFYDSFSSHAMETFLGTIRAWSHANGLLQTGHEVLSHVGSWTPGDAFGNWDLRVNFGLDHFGVDAFRDLTAVDAQDAVSQLSPKLGDAVARHSGRTGTIVEQYFMTPPDGGAVFSGHWGLTLTELRATAIRHHFQGMRQMVFHGFYQTDGHGGDHESLANPRFDFPPGVNFEPWYRDHHPAYALESSRLSAFLDDMTTPRRIALLWPLRSIWTNGQSGPHSTHFGEWARLLTKAGLEFEIIDERDLLDDVTDASAHDGPLYDVIILPHITTVRSAKTIDVLRGLTEAGTHLLASGQTPAVYQDGQQTAATDWDSIPRNGMTLVAEPTISGDILKPTAQADQMIAFENAPNLWSRRGTDSAGHTRLAVFNDGDAPLHLQGLVGRIVTEWDAVDGSRQIVDGARVTVVPNALRLFVFEDTAADDRGGSTATAEDVDTATLADGWTITLPGVEETPAPIRVDIGWESRFPDFSGIGRYENTLDLDPHRHHEIVLPSVAGSVELFIDGTSVGSRGWPPFRFTIPPRLLTGSPVAVRVDVASGAGNRYYAGTGLRANPEPSGITSTPELHTTI